MRASTSHASMRPRTISTRVDEYQRGGPNVGQNVRAAVLGFASAPHPVPASAGEQPHAHHPTQSPPHGRGRRPQPDDTHARERLTSRPHDRLAREHHQPQHRAHQCGQSSSHVDSLFCMRDCVPCPPLPPHGRCPPTSAPPRCTVRRVLPCSRAARPPPFHPP